MSPLTSTATEIIYMVCLYLDSPSLNAFSLTSHRLRSVATALSFRNIHITVASRHQLRLAIDRWTTRLQRLSCLNHVARLEINGTMPREDEDKDQTLFVDERDWNHGAGFVFVADDRPVKDTIDEDEAWRPLANFVRELPALLNLYYSCSNQFPPCLLSTLHTQLPHCRLHLGSFKIRTNHGTEFDHHEVRVPFSFIQVRT